MGGKHIAMRADHHAAGIDAFTAITRFLQNSQDGSDVPGRAGFLNRTQVIVLDRHCLTKVLGMEFLLTRVVETGAVGELNPERVTRNQALTEADHLPALISGRVDGGHDLLECGFSIEPHRGHLGETNYERG